MRWRSCASDMHAARSIRPPMSRCESALPLRGWTGINHLPPIRRDKRQVEQMARTGTCADPRAMRTAPERLTDEEVSRSGAHVTRKAPSLIQGVELGIT